MAKVIVFSNRKGGAGKTTLAYNTAAYLNKHVGKTLLIDLDSQSHATIHAGINPFSVTDSVYELFVSYINSKKVDKKFIAKNDELYIIPSSERIAALDIELSQLVEDKHAILKDILLELFDEFDYIVLDTPPALGLTTINALVASDFLIIPFKVDFFSLVGIGEVLNLYYRVNAFYSPNLKLVGVAPLNFIPRSNVSKEVMNNIKKNLGEKMILPQINQDVRFIEAASHGKSIFSYAPNCKGSLQMKALAEEIIRRMK